MSEVHVRFLGLCLYVSLSLFHNEFVGKLVALAIVIFGSMVTCRCYDIHVIYALMSLFVSVRSSSIPPRILLRPTWDRRMYVSCIVLVHKVLSPF
jgi:hypothetical protein